VWFLNEKYLAFDGSLDELTALRRKRPSVDSDKYRPNDIHDNSKESGIDKNLNRNIEESVNVPIKPIRSTNLDKFGSEDYGKNERSRNAEKIGTVSGIPAANNKSMNRASVSNFFDGKSQFSEEDSMNLDLQFSTWSLIVKQLFIDEFSSYYANEWLMNRSLHVIEKFDTNFR
jgi:hypothetical protein